jgi:hypothetical protein
VSLNAHLARLERMAVAPDPEEPVRAVVWLPAKEDGSGRPPGLYPGNGFVVHVYDADRPGTEPGCRDYVFPG